MYNVTSKFNTNFNLGTYGPANIIIDQLGCSCDPQTEFNFTISPPNYKLCPATTVKQTVSVTPTPHSEYKCLVRH